MYGNGQFLIKHLFGLFGAKVDEEILEGSVVGASEGVAGGLSVALCFEELQIGGIQFQILGGRFNHLIIFGSLG